MATDANDNQTDEYTYTEDNFASAFPQKRPPVSASIMTALAKQRSLMVVIALIAIVYVLVKVTKAIHHQSVTTKAPESQMTNENLSPPKMNTAQLNPLGVPPVATVTSNAADVKISADTIDKLDKSMSNVQDGIQGLNTGVQQIQQILAQQLAIQHQLMQAQLNKLQHEAAKQYTVYAVIPNRAWLLTPRGDTITVQPGTIITGLGQVTTINAAAGTVALNTGVTLRFASADG